MSDSKLDMVAVITGPTAGGKSALAMALAATRKSVIINADASQVYADLRLLTARPSPAEEAHIPHRLYGFQDGANPLTAPAWAALAKAEIAAALAAKNLPILVGGTGLYIETLLQGIAPIPEIAAPLRAEIRHLETSAAYAALVQEDPAMAARLKPSDRQRVLRALEVIRSTNQSLSHWQKTRTGGIATTHNIKGLIIAPPRETRWAAAATRLQTMMNEGALEEVQALTARHLDPALPIMKALGVAPLTKLLAGTSTREVAIAQTLAATRQYQKRQMTWIRGRFASWPRLERSEQEAMDRHFHMN